MRDLDALTSWYADWRSLRVVVFGLDAAGFAIVDTLTELGASVLAVEDEAAGGSAPELVDLVSVIGAEITTFAEIEQIAAELADFDPELMVVAAGFGVDHPVIAWAAARGIPIWGDIELAWRVRDKVAPTAHWNLVAGAGGVALTSTLAAHLLVGGGLRCVVAGSTGMLLLDAVRDPIGFDGLVVALSPNQLSWMKRSGSGSLAPEVSVCLAIDPHAAIPAAAYAAVYANTAIACVYNIADVATRQLVEEAEVQEGCRAIGFGLGAPGRSDLGMVGDIVVDRAFLEDRHSTALELTTHGELAEAGLATPELIAQVLAACAIARAHGVPPGEVRAALASFSIAGL